MYVYHILNYICNMKKQDYKNASKCYWWDSFLYILLAFFSFHIFIANSKSATEHFDLLIVINTLRCYSFNLLWQLVLIEFLQLNSSSNSAVRYGIIKANVTGRLLMCTTLTILCTILVFYSVPCDVQGFIYFAPYVKISWESRKNAS